MIRDTILPSDVGCILITEEILVGHCPLYFKLPNSSSDSVLVYPFVIVSSTQGLEGWRIFISYGEITLFGASLLTSAAKVDWLTVALTGQ